ncbi:hypothetical protein SAMN05880570_4092 [Paenibacillus sp. RU4T]|nr:hypothetical protein SAMN05880555_4090 [Paenibacillus sp. RU4X]SIR60724.1 hypothetical protein SAMN05880570_4092 [Paenibacillus sp. RU4T]
MSSRSADSDHSERVIRPMPPARLLLTHPQKKKLPIAEGSFLPSRSA